MKLPPINVGGIHGGEKYIYGNVLFKFAIDLHGLFQGMEELAQKAAANEIRAMNAVIQANVPHLHTTLTAMFYLHGRCIIATALAPLSASGGGSDDDGAGTLAYGSSDGAHTIRKKGLITQLIEKLANIYHLKPHRVVEGSSQRAFTVDVAVDLEGILLIGFGSIFFFFFYLLSPSVLIIHHSR